jgi:hypothetical protein
MLAVQAMGEIDPIAGAVVLPLQMATINDGQLTGGG